MTDFNTWLLRSIPGLPPILQTLHLLALAVLMASIVMICLRLLNLACRRQQLHKMLQRLFPWCFWALPVLLLTGLPFLLARPQRYLNNPVFMIKAAFLAASIVLTLIIWRRFRQGRFSEGRFREGGFEVAGHQEGSASLQSFGVKVLAGLTLISWLMTAMAGRWIAYADYLFWPG